MQYKVANSLIIIITILILMAVVIFTLSKFKPVFLSEENLKEALNSS